MKCKIGIACMAAVLLDAGAGSWIAHCQTQSAAAAQSTQSAVVLRFAVSGDSRNCGDVVMPGIARKFSPIIPRSTGIWGIFGPFIPSMRTSSMNPSISKNHDACRIPAHGLARLSRKSNRSVRLAAGFSGNRQSRDDLRRKLAMN